MRRDDLANILLNVITLSLQSLSRRDPSLLTLGPFSRLPEELSVGGLAHLDLASHFLDMGELEFPTDLLDTVRDVSAVGAHPVIVRP
jgi:hypothetical protein